jgi:hypothetical protein
MVVNADFNPRGGGTLQLPPIQQVPPPVIAATAAALRGAYVCHVYCPAGGDGGVAFVERQGDNLIFINEGGNQSRGVIAVDGTLLALDWGGGLSAKLEWPRAAARDRSEIHWSNGTVWHRVTLPNLSGSYTCYLNCPAGGQRGTATVTPQGERSLLFVNEGGGISGGSFKYPDTVVANEWGIHGVVVGNEIRWSDNTIWKRN